MNFMFEWQEQYNSCHENINFISSSQRVMFFLLYGDLILNNKRDARNQFNKSNSNDQGRKRRETLGTRLQKQKAGIVTSLNDTTLTKVTYGKYATRVPDEVAYGIYEWFSSQ